MFGSSNNVPKKPPKSFSINEERTDLVEQARPCPWFCGAVRVGLTWLGQPFNVLAKPITYDTKKEDVVAGYDYYAGAAGMIGSGELSSLEAVYFDEQLVWSGPLRNDGSSAEITIEGFGVMRIYWGSETQTVDASLAALSGATAPDPDEDHPAYRGRSYVVFPQLFLGESRTSFPNIEVIVSRWPQPSFMTANANTGGDCNPVAVFHDFMTHPRHGMGIPESRLDTSLLDMVADTLSSECLGISPFTNREEGAGSILTMLCEHINGYVYVTDQGKIALGLIRPTATAGIPAFDESDLVEVPGFSVASINETINEVNLKFPDRDRNYKESMAIARSVSNRDITNEPFVKSIERPWFTRSYAANLTAEIMVQMESIPLIDGTILIKKSSLGSLTLGGIFHLSYAHSGICNLLCRVIEITLPPPGESPVVSIRFQSDKGILSKGFSPPVVPGVPTPITHDPSKITNARLLEAPVAYLNFDAEVKRPLIIPLAARPTGVTVGFKVHVKQPSGSFAEVMDVDIFAQYGSIQSAYPIHPTIIDDTVGMDILLEGPDNTLPNTPIENNDDLLFAVMGNEILHVFGATLISAGRYQVYAFRAQAGTIQESHASGAGIFLINARNIPIFPVNGEAETITVKLQPYVAKGKPLDLSLVDEITLAITDLWARPQRPLNLEVKGTTATKISTYATGDDIVLGWAPGEVIFPSGYFESIANGGVTPTAETILEFYDPPTALRGTIEKAAGEVSHTLDNSDFQDFFLDGGSPTEPSSFTVRAYHRKNGFKSQYYVEKTVTKV